MLKGKLFVALVAVSLVPLPELARAQSAGKKPFVSQDHFPDQLLIYFSVSNIARLKDGFTKTVLGRIVTHPGTQRSMAGLLRRLAEEIESESRQFADVTGKTPLELLRLLEGEVAFALKRIGPAGLEAAFAIELGEGADELLSAISRLQRVVEANGQTLGTRKFGGHEATVWPLPTGPVFQVVLGSHLIVVTTPELLETIVSAYEGRSSGRSFKQSAVHAELQEALPVRDPEVVLEVDVPALRTLVLSGLAMTPVREQLPVIVGVSGVDRVSSLGFAAGFRDGGMEAAWHLGTRGGAGGVLETLRGGFPAIESVDAALAKVPGTASEFNACRIDLGKLLVGVDALLRRNFPEAGPNLDELYGLAETGYGISVESDLFTLGDLTLYGFAVETPARGLVADQLWLARSREVERYWTLAGKLAKAFGGRLRRIKWKDSQLEYLDFTKVTAGGEGLADIFREGGGTLLGVSALLVLVGESYVVRSDLGGGWTIIGNSPQAVRRYVDHFAGQPAVAKAEPFATLARTQVSGASLASVARGGFLLRAYDTAVSLAAGYFGRALARLGIDSALLPPAEIFLKRVKPGFVRLSTTSDGFTLHGHRPFESSRGGLVAVAVAGVVAGAFLPTLSSGRAEAYKVQCASNLKNIYVFSMLRADRTDRTFPHSPEGSVAAFQQLVDYFPDDFRGELFVCPGGHETPLPKVGGKLTLSAEGCSYEIVPWKLQSTTRSAILFYDKEPHHPGGRNVAFTDGSVMFLDEEDFQRRLEAERKRFGGR